eukprot:m.61522 g.61522  ORF g.61522 m.61522 type:complete len:607 (-) comp7090_c0_seq1:34-1854(-)
MADHVCPQCGNAVASADVFDHLDTCPCGLRKCPSCHSEIENRDFKAHVRSCILPCEHGCGLRCSAIEMATHRAECQRRPVTCPNAARGCQASGLVVADLSAHLAAACRFPCLDCGAVLQAKGSDDHSTKLVDTACAAAKKVARIAELEAALAAEKEAHASLQRKLNLTASDGAHPGAAQSPAPARKLGRPRKSAPPSVPTHATEAHTTEADPEKDNDKPKRRGRAPKHAASKSSHDADGSEDEPGEDVGSATPATGAAAKNAPGTGERRGRGRPPSTSSGDKAEQRGEAEVEAPRTGRRKARAEESSPDGDAGTEKSSKAARESTKGASGRRGRSVDDDIDEEVDGTPSGRQSKRAKAAASADPAEADKPDKANKADKGPGHEASKQSRPDTDLCVLCQQAAVPGTQCATSGCDISALCADCTVVLKNGQTLCLNCALSKPVCGACNSKATGAVLHCQTCSRVVHGPCRDRYVEAGAAAVDETAFRCIPCEEAISSGQKVVVVTGKWHEETSRFRWPARVVRELPDQDVLLVYYFGDRFGTARAADCGPFAPHPGRGAGKIRLPANLPDDMRARLDAAMEQARAFYAATGGSEEISMGDDDDLLVD